MHNYFVIYILLYPRCSRTRWYADSSSCSIIVKRPTTEQIKIPNVFVNKIFCAGFLACLACFCVGLLWPSVAATIFIAACSPWSVRLRIFHLIFCVCGCWRVRDHDDTRYVVLLSYILLFSARLNYSHSTSAPTELVSFFD